MRIVYLVRRKQPNYHSIERVFREVSYHAAGFCDVQLVKMPRVGFSIVNLIYVFFLRFRYNRTTVFHITGDVHYLALVLPARRTTLTIHDCVFLKTYSGFKKYILKKMYLDWPLHYLHHATVISTKTRSEIDSYCGEVRAKIHVVPNPLMPEFTYQPHHFNSEHPRILFVGTNTNKNFARAVEALKDRSCVFVVLGALNDEHITLLNNAGVVYENHFSLSDAEVADLYASVDLLLFPSLYEGFGLPVIEAFKTGRPVVTSNISPMAEIAEGAAEFVDPYSVSSIEEGLYRIISDQDRRTNLVRKGVAVSQKYDGLEVSRRYMAVYRELLKGIPA